MNTTALNLSVFGVILVRIFPHSDWIRRDTESVRIRENADQNNSEYGHFSRSVQVDISSQVSNFKTLKLREIRLYGDYVLEFKDQHWEYNRNRIGNKVLVVVLLS